MVITMFQERFDQGLDQGNRDEQEKERTQIYESAFKVSGLSDCKDGATIN